MVSCTGAARLLLRAGPLLLVVLATGPRFSWTLLSGEVLVYLIAQ
jgi:hypothetical protein